jgi:hypothetical protein
MSSSDSNNVYQPPQTPMIEDVTKVIESWKNVAAWIEKLGEVIEAHHQSCIALFNAEKELQGSSWESFQEVIVSFFRDQIEDPVRVAEENRLKDLVEKCARKADFNANRIRSMLNELALVAAQAIYITYTWMESIREQLLSNIRAPILYELLILIKLWGKATRVKRLLPDPTEFKWFECKYRNEPYALLNLYEKVSCNNIKPLITEIITEIIKEAEETAKLFPSSPDEPDTQTV